MEPQPLVSIIVVSYNHSRYTRENLDSIKAQTYKNIELIVADDASSDNSVEVFETWLQENNYPAKKNYHTKNTGLATTLNECVEMITGKYVKMIAADDYLHPESIKKCVEKLEELGEQYGMVFTDIYAVNDQSHVLADIADYNSIGKLSPDEFHKKLLKGNLVAALTVVMHTSVLKVTGKYNPEYLTEDYHRWLMINEKYKTGYVPQKLAYYRMHDSNISAVKKELIEKDVVKLQMIFDKNGSAKQEIDRFFNARYKNGQIINRDLLRYYQKYPFKCKRLFLAVKYHIPIYIYNIINRIV